MADKKKEQEKPPTRFATDANINGNIKFPPNLWFDTFLIDSKQVEKLKRILAARLNLLAKHWHSKTVSNDEGTMLCVLDKKSGRRVCYQLTNSKNRLGYVLTLCLNSFSTGIDGELVSMYYDYDDVAEVIQTPSGNLVLMNSRNQAQAFVDSIEEFFIKHRHAVRIYNEALAEAKRNLPHQDA